MATSTYEKQFDAAENYNSILFDVCHQEEILLVHGCCFNLVCLHSTTDVPCLSMDNHLLVLFDAWSTTVMLRLWLLKWISSIRDGSSILLPIKLIYRTCFWSSFRFFLVIRWYVRRSRVNLRFLKYPYMSTINLTHWITLAINGWSSWVEVSLGGLFCSVMELLVLVLLLLLRIAFHDDCGDGIGTVCSWWLCCRRSAWISWS